MVSNVTEFPKKYDVNKPHDFMEAYTKSLVKLDDADRPTNILVLEMYRDPDGETTMDHYVTGPDMHISEIIGNIEAWKMWTLPGRTNNED